MKYRDLQIQTQRTAPNNARTEGFSLLVRAGYLTRDSELTPLGEMAVKKLEKIQLESKFEYFRQIGIPVIEGRSGHVFYITVAGRVDILKCGVCDYSDLMETAIAQHSISEPSEKLPVEKIHTPDCNTIEALATFLKVDKFQTAKAMMFIRVSDGKFIFIVMRGDTQLNLYKLKNHIGEVRPATTDEIKAVGAMPGYASPIGVKNALVIVDELIPQSVNLVAGANEEGYHLLNTNYGRDYSADMPLEIVQAEDGNVCANCEDDYIYVEKAEILVDENDDFNYTNILLALAESHHDENGLTLPNPAAPFDLYLMHISGKDLDTRTKAEEIYNSLQNAGIPVLFDDRDERAGVKFNDADLIGCPVRVTVGEKGLKEGMVELKLRKAQEKELVQVEKVLDYINSAL